MLRRRVERFFSDIRPWEVYQNLYPEADVCFFLDSISRRLPDQNYSYILSRPFLEFSLKPGASPAKARILVRSGTGREKILRAKDWLKALGKQLASVKVAPAKPMPFFTGGAAGYWAYDLVPLLEPRIRNFKTASGLRPLYLGFFKDVIVYDHAAGCYWLVTHEGRRTPKARKTFQNMKSFFRRAKPFSGNFEISDFKPEMPRARFQSMVRRAKRYIQAGDIYQANLSQRFTFRCPAENRLKLYDSLREINPSPFSSFLKIRGLEIISCSPERLVSKRGGICETRPIAGTRKRPSRGGLRAVRRELLSNEKERAEHIMLVDLERNDLGRVCDWPTVKVEEMMKTETYSHVIHIVSKITGRISRGRSAIDLMQAMFPGGTVTGCPKIRCMEIINELEPSARGLYTGSIGYLDFSGGMDMNIVIRTLVLQGERGHFQVGAGIVHDSDPAREYEETLHKGEALAEALARAASGG
ncbi:MAG: anthranilate synthase component I family protein [Candidatus Omnitrophica bacterium]|nr:anthranilate synthase component I family protein [Candidatus Omnitrophota bacterium]